MEDIRDNFQLISKLFHQNIAIVRNLERDPDNGNYRKTKEDTDLKAKEDTDLKAKEDAERKPETERGELEKIEVEQR